MKLIIGRIVTAFLVLTVSVLTAAPGPRVNPVVSAQPAASLTDSEALTLLYLREEEKLARDVYTFLYETWNLMIFEKIATAEQSHMDAILKKLVKYGLPDSAEGMEPGQFTEQSGLQAIYDEMVSRGVASKSEALAVGVDIETLSVAELFLAMEGTDKADLLRVYGRLEIASEKHLKAFSRHLE
jgi:hypothetical protein